MQIFRVIMSDMTNHCFRSSPIGLGVNAADLPESVLATSYRVPLRFRTTTNPFTGNSSSGICVTGRKKQREETHLPSTLRRLLDR